MKNGGVILISGKLSGVVRHARFIQSSLFGNLRDLFLIQETGHLVYRKSIHRRHDIIGKV